MRCRRLSAVLALLSLATGVLVSAAAFAADPGTTSDPDTSPDTTGLFTGKPRAFTRTTPGVVGVYVPNWMPPALIEQVPPGNLTHVLYAFLRICGPGQLAKDADACHGKPDFELAVTPLEQRFNEVFTRYKQRAPQLKIVASVGGWGGSDPFFHLANDPARRAVFVASAQRFLREHPAFDGIDIDWEHPGDNGSANGVALGSPADGQGYADLMTDLRHALDTLGRETGRHYLVTTAVNSTATVVRRIHFKQAAEALDLVFMMTYDYYGSWSPVAGNHSALRSSSEDSDDSLTHSIRTFIDAGVPPAKLVAGVAMYGRGFTGVAQPKAGEAKTGTYPDGEGAMAYRDIAHQLLDQRGRGRKGYASVWDPATQSWSLYNVEQKRWMGYDDPRAVIAKAREARAQGLAGVFAWELSQDNGDLLNAMNLGMGGTPASAASSTSPTRGSKKESRR